MDNEPGIALRIREPEDFDMGEPMAYVPVASSVVDFGIDLLQCFVSQWKLNAGSEPEHDVWDRLAVAGAQMLAGLVGASAHPQPRGAGRLCHKPCSI
jgi:hypothetical protein